VAFEQPSKEPSLPPMLANPPMLTPVGPVKGSPLFAPTPLPVARPDEYHLARFNAKSRAIEWTLDTAKRRTYQPFAIASAPRFDEALLADNIVAAHLTNGRCWIINAANGAILGDLLCDSGAWRTPPVRLDESHIAIPTSPGTVTAVEIPSVKTSWTFDVAGSAGLAGFAPELHREGKYLNALVTRNHGCELHRLDSKGQSVWSGPAFLDAATITLQDMAADSQRLYLPLPNRVVALRSDNGKQIWEANLPTGRWSLQALGNAVTAIPRSGETSTVKNIATTLASRLSTMGLLQVSAALLEPDRQPILILDPDTGQVWHKLDNYDGPITAVAVRVDGLWLATPRTIYRLK
jgi:hypothetical protein